MVTMRKAPGLADEERTGTSQAADSEIDECSIYNNITFSQARIITANIGVENRRRIAGRKVTITSNKFGQDMRRMTGDQGGDATKSFNDNFWK